MVKSNKVDSKSLEINIGFEKSAPYVFDCIRQVSKWWSTDFEGRSAEVNDEFVIHHPGAHYSKQKVVEIVPGKKIVWLVTESTLHWLQGDKHEWTNTRMIFDITAEEGKTKLRITHEGLTPEKECYERCSEGWNMVIKQRLIDFIVNGKTVQ